jgi:amino acid transporter
VKTIGVLAVFFKKMGAKLKRYSIENWGFPFISTFLVLLFTSAVLLSSGLASVAETTSILAYFSLLIGVILQIICFSRNRKNGGTVL